MLYLVKTPVHYIIKINFFLFAAGMLMLSARAQSVKAIEYFFDKDPGIGNGTRIDLSPAAMIDTNLVFDMSALSFGLHQLFIRSQDTSSKWGLYHIYPVIKGVGTTPGVLQKLEYYFDKDPGFGNGFAVNLSPASSADMSIMLDLSNTTEGLHQVFFRAMDNTGKWSLYHTYTVIKGPGYSDPLTVNKMEYFFDTDPGVGKATPLGAGQHFMVDTSFLLSVPRVKKDSINLFVRAMDNRGLWGLYHDTMIAISCNLYPLKSYIDFSAIACGNTIISFVDTSTAMQWKWNFGNGDSASGQQPVYSFTKPGNYNVSHYTIDEYGCISDTVNRTITVQPPVTVDAGPDQEINLGDDITLHPLIEGNDSAYLWTPNLYSNSNTIRNPTITPLNDITYYLTVTSKGGCTASDSILIKVNKTPQLIYIPNAFSPNGDGINDTWIIKYLNTYPSCHVQVFNRYGQVVFESNGYANPWNGRYRNQPLPLGTYYYLITPGKGKKPLSGSISIVY